MGGGCLTILLLACLVGIIILNPLVGRVHYSEFNSLLRG